MTSTAPGPAASPATPLIMALGGAPRVVIWTLVAVVIIAATAATYLGATLSPDYSQPTGVRAEAKVTRILGMPREADAVLVGDVLIERFYARDVTTGKLYVGDMVKGRVSQLVENAKPDSTVVYSVLLDRSQLDPGKVTTLVRSADPPASSWQYLGAKVQGGNTELFQINYGGRLPEVRGEFRGPKGEDIPTMLAKFPSGDIGPTLRVLSNKENNYLLNSTRNYPYFTALFGIKEAVFVTSLIFVDATSSGADLAPAASPTPTR